MASSMVARAASWPAISAPRNWIRQATARIAVRVARSSVGLQGVFRQAAQRATWCAVRRPRSWLPTDSRRSR
ncbi:MAG: hypothetical protein ACRD0A_06500 [Acidimicrobiales bacterium]